MIAGIGAAIAALVLAPAASAAPSWVEDEGASICNTLSLGADDSDWVRIGIQSLQLGHDASRAEALSGMRAAAADYCPEYLSVVPSR